MPSVLVDIIGGVREDLAVREREVPRADLERAAEKTAPPRDGEAALRVPGLSLIAEVKRASPSRGPLAAIEDPAALAAAYQTGGANAVSVLTEARRFQGSLADLDAVRAAVHLPVLRKDFIVTSYQVWEARAHGADIVLLIVAALEQPDLVSLVGLTRTLGMTPLVEVHDGTEVARALDAGATVVGVNARDLTSLTVDRSTFARVAPLIPDTCVRVAESGIGGPEDARALADLGADAVLVGEALVTGGDPVGAVRSIVSAEVTS